MLPNRSRPIMISIIVLLLVTVVFAKYSNDKETNYFLNKLGIQKTNFHWNAARNGKQWVTNLDNFRDIVVLGRHILLKSAKGNFEYLFKSNWNKGKIQRPRAPWEKFPCPLNNSRSHEIPTSVHRLRPGDIDVIAAIGDSLSAGNGVVSETIMHIGSEFRSMAFSGGGASDWRSMLTLPNILKVFNPNLYGYATADVLTVQKGSYLNIAEPMIMSRDTIYQAQILIARMRTDPNIDMARHWKLLTIFVGSNDICSDMCHYDNIIDFLRRHEQDLRAALTLLRNNVPRLLINLIPAPNMVTTLYQMKNVPFQCQAVHRIGCHCIFSDLYNATMLRWKSNIINRWQHIDQYIAALPEFQTNDFAVLYQPFTANMTLPTLPNGDTDLRYFASDCFHFSQLGHAAVANILWNNMLLPQSQRDLVDPFMHFECPSEQRPYIATRLNSAVSRGNYLSYF